MNDDLRRLKDELGQARATIIALMPDEIRKVLESYLTQKREDAHKWEYEAVERILEFAQPRPAQEMGESLSSTQRTFCPLCERNARPGASKGYAFPRALFDHLLGRGNLYHCPVFRAALALARDYFGSRGSH